MTRKLIVALLTVALALTGIAAFAATYTDPDEEITFQYDESFFAIDTEDITDDELLVVLGFADEAWGEGYIRVHLQDLEDGEAFPTLDDFAEIEESLGVEVTQGDWDGFVDVFMYTIDEEDTLEQVCIVPVFDAEDGEIEEILTVNVAVEKLEDEGVAMERDDQISAVLDTLQFVED